jgi:hypothetical protein
MMMEKCIAISSNVLVWTVLSSRSRRRDDYRPATNSKHRSIISTTALTIHSARRKEKGSPGVLRPSERGDAVLSSRHLAKEEEVKEFGDYLLGDYFVKMAYKYPGAFIMLLLMGLVATCISTTFVFFLPAMVFFWFFDRIQVYDKRTRNDDHVNTIQGHTTYGCGSMSAHSSPSVVRVQHCYL